MCAVTHTLRRLTQARNITSEGKVRYAHRVNYVQLGYSKIILGIVCMYGHIILKYTLY